MMLYYGTIMAYNEELLAKEGLSVPKTYAEFLAAARKTTKDTNNDGILDQFGTGHETKGRRAIPRRDGKLHPGCEGELHQPGRQSDHQHTTNGRSLTRWKTIVKENLTPRSVGG